MASKFASRAECFIIQDMKVHKLHEWEVSVARAREIQLSLAKKLVIQNEDINPRLVAGMDISSPNAQGVARGAVVVLRYPELSIVEIEVAEDEIRFPYIPGLLSFRETPLILAACEKLHNTPDLMLYSLRQASTCRRRSWLSC
jgi:deoxyribonuclease V